MTRRAALSPSRAKDYMQCPLLFRYRTVDKLPEPPSKAAVKGTLVHAVLERLFDLPATERTERAAHAMLDPEWAQLQHDRPEVTAMFTGREDLAAWLGEARTLLTRYFTLENPTRLEPAQREQLVETELPSGVLLRGFIDRVDVAPGTGAVRIVDYKSGKGPSPRFQDSALFQMRFYGLMIWRLTGRAPARLQLVYLGNSQILTLDPTEADLAAMERELDFLWQKIATDARAGTFAPRTTRLCDWCNFQAYCPAYGGTPPPVPADGIRHLLTAQTPAPVGS